KLANGRIYTGKQAANLKLVDRLGGLQDALKAAAADAGIKGEFSVVQYRKSRGILDLLFGGLDTNLLQSSEPAEVLGKLAERFLQSEENVNIR
ncbi:MAG: S49 family peptidase, partial [Armatimonadota bacterium]